MNGFELAALSLLLSILAGGLAWGLGSAIEQTIGDPRLRDAIWGAGLVFCILPPVALALLLLTPAPVLEITAPALAPVIVSEVVRAPMQVVPAPSFSISIASMASAALALAGLLGLLRLGGLALRTVRLARLLRNTTSADDAVQARVLTLAASLDVTAPRTVISATATEALLSGFGRARLILPAHWTEGAETDAVVAHELAHLKRGDHRTLWLEETLGVLLAFNPLFPILRARRDAAREEACDALALTNAGPEVRRAYAQTLIQSLRDRAGPHGRRGPVAALTFTGAGRTTMHRLKAVLSPAAPAGRGARTGALLAGLAGLVAVTAAASALAAQREPTVRERTTVADGIAFGPDRAPDPRYQRVSAERYQGLCASGDDADEGFCAGVLFAHMVAAPGNGLCLPPGIETDDAVLDGFVVRGKAEVARLTPRRDESATEYAERALKQAYACDTGRGLMSPAALSPQPALQDFERLTVRVRQPERMPLLLHSRDRLRLTMSEQDGAEGVRRTSSMEMPLSPDQPVEREAFFTLRNDQLPGLARGRTYELRAEIVGVEGRATYAAEPVTVRLAPGSRGQIAEMRPELVMAPVPRQAAPQITPAPAPAPAPVPTPASTPTPLADAAVTEPQATPRPVRRRTSGSQGLVRSFASADDAPLAAPGRSLQPRIMSRTQPGRRGAIY